mmetsp:Transcript_19994/g.50404  ORF Transcript_19994/g.50404 Transcript_19994/m.50404 type:complete len:87 (+) Transcript_19994:2557-2817(+)
MNLVTRRRTTGGSSTTAAALSSIPTCWAPAGAVDPADACITKDAAATSARKEEQLAVLRRRGGRPPAANASRILFPNGEGSEMQVD